MRLAVGVGTDVFPSCPVLEGELCFRVEVENENMLGIG